MGHLFFLCYCYMLICSRHKKVIVYRLFVYNAVYHLTLTFFLCQHTFQFVNNRPIYFAIHWKMCPKSVGNQIYGGRFDVHLMKTQSTVVEMF